MMKAAKKITGSAKAPRVVLGVTGSIAAYRAADIASTLTKAGVIVDVVMTSEAERFVTPLTLECLSRRSVTTASNEGIREGQPTHIHLADSADLVLVAPATAQIVAQYAHGFASDVLTCLLLATLAPVYLAPAMNGKMWEHAATQSNVALLKKRGVNFIGPDAGLLACGYEGIGRLWPAEKIAEQILRALRSK